MKLKPFHIIYGVIAGEHRALVPINRCLSIGFVFYAHSGTASVSDRMCCYWPGLPFGRL
jgi:hypothetical protein